MKQLSLFILTLITTAIVNAQSIEAETFVLDNGLTVILSEDHSKPEVFGVVVTKAGGKNDPKDATGMAHYMEHMLFKGTQELGTVDWEKEKVYIDQIFKLYDQLGETNDEETRKKIQLEINQASVEAAKYAIPNETSNLIKSMGGTQLNAGTGPDNTVFYNAFPPNQIEKWIDLYSQRFINPVFRSFQAELEVVYEEKNMYEDMFIFPLIEKFNYHFFKQHPYGQQTLIGTIDDLKNPSLTKMFKFFQTYYVANNMGLIIVGDFDADAIKPIIKEKFGQWRSGKIPEPIKYEEKPFEGRELIEAKMTPIKLGLLGYRAPAKGSQDEMAFQVCNGILSNTNGTGLFDKLMLNNELMAAQVLAMPYQDYGASILLFVPKILGQKLDDAEALLQKELTKLKSGDFEDWMIDAVKYDLYVNYMKSLESAEDKALILTEMFAGGKTIDDLNKTIDELQAITKDDIVKIANKYYTDNYLAFHSKMGFPKKQKIEKPSYEALKSNTDAKSKYAKHFDSIKSSEPVEKYIDFTKDFKQADFIGGTIYSTINPINDIFSFKIKFGVGDHVSPKLKYAASAMNYAGTSKLDLNAFKMEFSKIGCSYSIYSNDSYTIVEVEGIEKNFDKAVQLISELISDPVLDQNKIEKITEEIKTERKMERSEPDNIASALLEYVRYKDESEYLTRLSLKEIKALQATDLTALFKNATGYSAEVHLVAKNIEDKDLKIAEAIGLNNNKISSTSPIYVDPQIYSENTVFFVNKKKALQSKVFFLANEPVMNLSDQPTIDAFNLYFGGGFSGLVLQEIREYRSLAYSAGARFTSAPLKGKPSYFMGFVGTQADKTSEAMEVFNGLIRNMPEKPERSVMIKDYLIQSAFSDMPDFRNLTETVVEWKHKGYTEDPSISKVKAYRNYQFSDIIDFYKKHIQKTPIVTIMVGNKKKLDYKSLNHYGKLKEIKEKKLFH
ncbi:MAG: insulinase family protein [Bacteroidales bacterium]|nr:insulinase family protein [Bacteroidales bacterium]